jgi:hypothetical protein
MMIDDRLFTNPIRRRHSGMAPSFNEEPIVPARAECVHDPPAVISCQQGHQEPIRQNVLKTCPKNSQIRGARPADPF